MCKHLKHRGSGIPCCRCKPQSRSFLTHPTAIDEVDDSVTGLRGHLVCRRKYDLSKTQGSKSTAKGAIAISEEVLGCRSKLLKVESLRLTQVFSRLLADTKEACTVRLEDVPKAVSMRLLGARRLSNKSRIVFARVPNND